MRFEKIKLISLLHLFLLFISVSHLPLINNNWAQSQVAASTVPRKIIANGEVIVINGKYYVSEGVIGTEGEMARISLIPVESIPVNYDFLASIDLRFFIEYPNNTPSSLLRFVSSSTYPIIKSSNPTHVFEGNPTLYAGFNIKEGKKNGYVVAKSHLGSGGLNDVYKAEVIYPPGQFASVALKVGKTGEGQKELLNGAKLAESLPKNVAIQVYDSALVMNAKGEELAISIMELQSGITLDKYIKDKFGFPMINVLDGGDSRKSKEAWEFVFDLQEKMKEIENELKSRQIVHGDIKLGNLVIEETNDGFILKLTDFDTMKKVGEKSIMSTPSYVDPWTLYEISRRGEFTLSTDMDKYAFQSSLYRLIFGKSPNNYLSSPPKNLTPVKAAAELNLTEFQSKFKQIFLDVNDDWNRLLLSVPRSLRVKLIDFKTQTQFVFENPPVRIGSLFRVVSSKPGANRPPPSIPETTARLPQIDSAPAPSNRTSIIKRVLRCMIGEK